MFDFALVFIRNGVKSDLTLVIPGSTLRVYYVDLFISLVVWIKSFSRLRRGMPRLSDAE